MNDWVFQELRELEQTKQDDTAKSNRLNLLQQQTIAIWGDLKPVLEDAVEKLNTIPEFKKMTGGIVYAPGEDRIEIRKRATVPSVELAISRAATSISLAYSRFNSPRGPERKAKPHALNVDLDENGRPLLKNEQGEVVTLEQAAHQIMRPFLHPELLE
jgi:hypothetical protein